MAERDVKLVIRAKNEAKRTIDSVADALKTLDDAQKSVGSSASKTDDLIGRLGQEFSKLNAQITASAAIGKVSEGLNKAGQAVKSLQQNVVGAEKRLGELAAASKAAAANTAELERQAASLAAQQKVEREALDAANKSLLKKADAQKELTAAQKAYNVAMKVPAGREGRDDGIIASKARLDAAKAAVEANVQTQARLKAAYDATTGALKRMNADVKDSGGVYKRLQGELADTVAQIGRSQTSLNRANAEYAELKTIVDGATASMGRFGAEQRDVAATTAQLTPQVEKLSGLMKTLDHYATGDGGFDTGAQAAAMRKQVEALDAARNRYALLRSEIDKLNSQIRSSGSATAKQAQDLRTLSSAANAAEREVNEMSGALNRLRSAGSSGGVFGAINRESRQAMSIMQRLRGEVLALATAYVGLYGAISNVGGVIAAYQKMEAAQNRMSAVFKQDSQLTNRELAWTERQADRLGIEFGSLANEYSKFAVAAQAANFSMEGTRTIFMRVAEAGRVNKLSMEEMNLIFLALQQMISKGAIQSEELKQQLGERLPGAFNIMAEAMGVTTAEMMKMMEAGELLANESNMLKFARELDKRFGGQLAASLRTTSTEIGRFQNNLFQAQLQFANAGFIESFTNGLRDLNKWFDSDAGVQFFTSLGSAAGKVIEILRVFAENADILTYGLQVLVAVKLGSWLFGIIDSLRKGAAGMRALSVATTDNVTATNTAAAANRTFVSTLSGAATGMRSFGASVAGLGGHLAAARASMSALGATTLTAQTRMVAAAGAMAALRAGASALTIALGAARTAMLGLVAAFGGPAGIAVAIGSFFAIEAITSWMGSVDQATEALERHRSKMNNIVGEYEKLDPAVRSWSKALEGFRLSDLETDAKKLGEQFQSMFKEVSSGESNPFKSWYQGWNETARQIDNLRKKMRDGEMSAQDYADSLADIYGKVDNAAAKEYIAGLQKEADRLAELEKAYKQALDAADKKRAADKGLAEGAEELKGALDDLVATTNASAESLHSGADAAKRYQEGLDALKAGIPALAAEMKKLKDLSELDATVLEKWGYGPYTQEQQGLIDQRREVILSEADQKIFKEIAGNTKVTREMFNDIFKEESFRSKAYDDGYGTMTIGYGSTRINGRAVQAGDTITKDQGMQQAVKDLGVLIAQIESMVKVSLSDGQLRALTSYAYNAGIGSLKRDGILAPLNRGDYDAAEKAIRNGVDTSKGKYVPGLRARREREADLFASGRDDPAVVKQIADDKERAAEADRKAGEATKKRIEDQKFEISQQDLKNVGKEREAAIEAAVRQAQQENKNISAEELEIIRQQAGALFDKQQLKNIEKADNEQIKAQMKEVNDLESQRTGLLEQRKIYEGQGNTDKVAEVQAQLAGVNAQLQEAIDKAIAMYQALGGAGADAAIVKLQNTGLAIQQASQNAQNFRYSAEQISTTLFNIMDSGIINAFDQLAQAIAKGENAGKAFGQALLQMFSQMLIQIGKMIIQQTIYNMLLQFSKSLGGGIFSAISGGVMHSGGVVGAGMRSSKSRPAELWSNAVRYHSGGIAGLAPREFPAVLELGEEVLTDDDPRHVNNLGKGGGGGGSAQPAANRVRIVNMFDSGSFLSEALNSVNGEEVLLNYVRNNSAAFKQAMG